MAKSKTFLTLKSNPSGPPEHGPMDAYTWCIMKGDDGYKISINRAGEDGTRQRKVFGLNDKTADRWLDHLRVVRISIMLNISDSCDGSYYTFKFQSDGVGIELYWYNTSPEGAVQVHKKVLGVGSCEPNVDISNEGIARTVSFRPPVFRNFYFHSFSVSNILKMGN